MKEELVRTNSRTQGRAWLWARYVHCPDLDFCICKMAIIVILTRSPGMVKQCGRALEALSRRGRCSTCGWRDGLVREREGPGEMLPTRVQAPALTLR